MALSFVADYRVASWDTTTATKACNVTAGAGDLLVVVGGAALSTRTLGTPSGGGLTWTSRTSVAGFSGYPTAYIWTATATTTGTFSLSITASGSSIPWGFMVLRFAGGTVGASASTHAAGAPSLALTTGSAGSTVVCFAADAYAQDTPRTYRTVNGFTPTPANGLDRWWSTDADWTVYTGYYPDAGAAGAKTVGLTTPTGQQYSIVAVELVSGGSSPPPSGGGGGGASPSDIPHPVIMEAAWGADLSADPATWTWVDISADVRQTSGDPGLTISRGRADESSQTAPTKLAFGLRNPRGDYTPHNPASRWAPYVRLGTPLRATVCAHVRAYTYITSIAPSWDESIDMPVVSIESSGLLDLLDQARKGEAHSALWRALSGGDTLTGHNTTPVAYWSCEEPAGSTRAREAFGGSPAVGLGLVEWAADSRLKSSGPLPKLTGVGPAGDPGGARLSAQIRSYSATGDMTVTAVVGLPSSAPDPQCTLLTVRSALSSSSVEWRVVLGASWTLNVEAWDNWGSEILGASNVQLDERFTDSSAPVMLALSASVDGSTLDGSVTVITADGVTITASGSQSSGLSSIRPTYWEIYPAAALGTMTAGQVSAWSQPYSAISNTIEAAMAGWPWETPSQRAVRLCREAGVGLSLPGAVQERSPATGGAQTMGPQSVAPLVSLLRECEAAGGLLSDGLTTGLTFLPQAIAPLVLVNMGARYNRPPELTLDVRQGHLAPGFSPIEDDQRRKNDITVSGAGGGGSGRYTDVSGPLGTAAIGRRPDSANVNVRDDALDDAAGWLVHMGTTDMMRYPVITLYLHAHPELISAWCALDLGSRVQITNLMATHGASTLDLVLEGYTEHITSHSWVAELTSSAFAPWVVAVIESADPATRLRADTDGSKLHTAASIGATSLSIDTTTGPLWTTQGGDMPLDLDIGGRRVTVTAISGASSPQTATCSPLPWALPVNAPVRLWQPPVLAL